MKGIFAWIVLIFLAGFLIPGCVKRMTLSPWISKISKVGPPGESEEIFRLPEGEKISFHQLIDDLNMTTVIFVGESHDQIEHHQIQVRILQELLKKGKEITIAMEMFERSKQPTLDRWSQGLLSEEEFLKEVQWETSWGIPYPLYKGILEEAKAHRLKVLGLNIQRDLVRKVGQKGISGLSPDDKNVLPEIDLNDSQHRAYITSIFKSHQGGSAKDLEYFYQAQCLWDEGMAETLSEYLKSSHSANTKTVLVFAGSGHMVFDFGIPKRFYRRTPLPYQTVVLKTWKKRMDEDLTFVGSSSPLANFLWITNPNPPEKKKPRIGVFLKTKEQPKGIWIESVIPGSPAEKAGLLSGDQFVEVEGKEIIEIKDIHHILEQKGWGNDVTFIIRRDGVRQEITVILPLLED